MEIENLGKGRFRMWLTTKPRRIIENKEKFAILKNGEIIRLIPRKKITKNKSL